MSKDQVRIRFAPSPTGYLHVGGARTALFNWLFARHSGGKFILRIEDTDRTRYQPDALPDLLDSLRWLGLDWDEGPVVGGPYGPYYQSDRQALYHDHAQRLVEEGQAYKCFCSPERLAQLRAAQRQRKEPPGYDRHCRQLSQKQLAEHEAAGDPYVIRLAVPLEGQTTVHDLLRGDITVENHTQNDLVLLKSDGFPTYHLANVVDDHLMEISHIMRADEWIPSAPRHKLLYQAFGWEMPLIAHMPIILDPSGKGKMSKRKKVIDGKEYPVQVREFRQEGYLPEAVFNFLALVGWSYDDRTELMTRQELVERFTIERINPSPAAFPYHKLENMNGIYMRAMGRGELSQRLIPVLREAGVEANLDTMWRLTPLIQERIKTLKDAVAMVDFFFTDEIDYEAQLLIGKKMTVKDSLQALRQARETLAAAPDFEEETMETALRALTEELHLKAGQLFGIIRVAVTGKKVAPPLFGTLSILGREKTLKRLDKADKLFTEYLLTR